MLKSKKRLVAILVLSVSLLLITLVIGLIQRNNQVQYSPKGSNNIAGPLVIKAKENIKSGSGSYHISPSVAGNLQVVDNYIIFWPEQEGGFVLGTAYSVEFTDYKTVSQEIIEPVNIVFTITKDADYDDLQKEVLSKYGHFEASFNPFLEKLPHKEDYRYKISYAINERLDHGDETEEKQSDIVSLLGDKDNWKEKKDNYIVYIETHIFQSRDQSFESYVREVKLARQEALKWIADQGVDVEKDINYEFIPDDSTLLNPSSGREEVPSALGEDY